MTEVVEAGTLVWMNGIADNGGKYEGLAFVREAHRETYEGSQYYNLAAFESKPVGWLDRVYVGPARTATGNEPSSASGWLGGVKREDFTVLELPERDDPAPEDGIYLFNDKYVVRRTTDSATYWETLLDDGTWYASSHISRSTEKDLRDKLRKL